MNSNRNIKGVYKEHRGPFAKWLWRWLDEKEIKEYEFAKIVNISPQALSTIMGGEDRLSENNLIKLVQGLIKLGCINSGAEFQEFLDVLWLCPGYKPGDGEDDRLRVVAGKGFEARGIVPKDAASATLDRLHKEVRALSKRDLNLLEETKLQEDVKFHRLISLFRYWRQE